MYLFLNYKNSQKSENYEFFGQKKVPTAVSTFSIWLYEIILPNLMLVKN